MVLQDDLSEDVIQLFEKQSENSIGKIESSMHDHKTHDSSTVMFQTHSTSIDSSAFLMNID